MKYYSLNNILKYDAQYYIIFGERSNGKTTAAICYGIANYAKGNGNMVYLRQMDMDIQGGRGESVMNSLRFGGPDKDENLIAKYTEDKYDTVKYFKRAWYLGKNYYDEDGNSETLWEKEPFAYAMAISQMKHDKSATPPNVTTVVFDEFMPFDGTYLIDETAKFRNVISTIVRDSARVKVFMCANSTTWNSPYFKMFGLNKKVRDMVAGDITVVKFPKTQNDGSEIEMKVVMEYCENNASKSGKASDVYFVMADEHSAMITDGEFAVPDYPQCPHHFTKDNVKCTYWVMTDDDEILRSRLMRVGRDLFVFVDKVTDELMDATIHERRDVIYSLEFTSNRNHFTSPTTIYRDVRTRYMAEALATNRVFFEDNETGEDFMYFARTAAQRSITAL